MSYISVCHNTVTIVTDNNVLLEFAANAGLRNRSLIFRIILYISTQHVLLSSRWEYLQYLQIFGEHLFLK